MDGRFDPDDGTQPPQPQGSPVGPYGLDASGRPWSDKSKVTAGLPQLIPGFFFALGGIGRLYAGDTSLGIIQLLATLIGWVAFVCGLFILLPWIITGAFWLWFVIDGIVLLAGSPRDPQGRLLRS